MILHLIKFIFSKQYRKQCVISDVMCSCGKYEKCIRKIKVKDGGYFGNTKLYVDNKDHFRCGKVQKQIKQIKGGSPASTFTFDKESGYFERD